jgi:hypothetical protein
MRASLRIVPLVLAGLVTAGLASPAAAATTYSSVPVPTWTPNGAVYSIAVSHGIIYLGGSFTTLTNASTGQTVVRRGLAALNEKTGAPIATWHPRVNSAVRAIAVQSKGGNVFVGGDFTKVNGKKRSHLVALTKARGSIHRAWRGTANGNVRALLIVKKELFVGGDFAKVRGHASRGLGALSVTQGKRNTHFAGTTENGPTYTMALSHNKKSLILGGRFTAIDGRSRDLLGSVRVKTGAVNKWRPAGLCRTCSVFSVAADKKRVFVGAAGPGGELVAYLAALNAQAWNDHTNGDVQSVVVKHGVLYVGGHFGGGFHTSATVRFALATVHPTTGGVHSDFAPNLQPRFPGVFAIAVTPKRLWAGGGFTSVAGSTDARLAAFPKS